MIANYSDNDYQKYVLNEQIEILDDEMDILEEEYNKTEEQWKDGYAGIISGIRQEQERLKEKLHYLIFGEY